MVPDLGDVAWTYGGGTVTPRADGVTAVRIEPSVGVKLGGTETNNGHA